MITFEQLIDHMPGRLLCGDPATAGLISGGYACDMLSLVVSRIEPGQIWLTILNSINVVAVASLAECPYVILTDGVTMNDDVLQRASDKGLAIYSTPLSTFAAAAFTDRLLQPDE